jgi:Leucine-rich repeat (LRR) protein
MCSKLTFALVLCLGLFVQDSKTQEPREVRLRCVFEDFPIYQFVQYACILRNIDFDFTSPFYYITIEGEHMPGRNNSHVLNLVIQTSVTNVIPANIFQLFPNVQYIEAFRSGIRSLGATSLTFASQLRGLFVNYNNIASLVGTPFFARGGITHLNLYANGINTIGPTFFMGLTGLRYLSLGGNNLRTIAPDVLAPMVNLRHFLASGNEIETLSPRTFTGNRQLEIVALEYNNITSLGPNIFNGLNLEFLGLNGNECVNVYFESEGAIDIDEVNESLQTCFDSFVPEPPRRRALLLELRGNMTLFDEYNRELLGVTGRAV